MKIRIGRRAAVLGLVVAVLVVGGAAAKLARDHARTADLCEAVTAQNVQRHDDSPVVTGGPVAVVLGDSYAQGAGLDDPRASWPTPLGQAHGWTTYVNAVGGTGFSNGGYCGGQDYRSRTAAVLAHRPDVVIVQGGLNDTDAGAWDERAAVAGVLADLVAVPQVIVVGPVAAPSRPDADVVDEQMRAVTEQAGRRYVSALGWPVPFSSDQLHMTPAGHPQFAQLVAAALR